MGVCMAILKTLQAIVMSVIFNVGIPVPIFHMPIFFCKTSQISAHVTSGDVLINALGFNTITVVCLIT